jgi:hypothetical protein
MAAGVNYAELHVPISGKIQLTNEPSHSLYQRNRLECLLCIATRSVVAFSLVYWSAAACAMHTTHFPAPDSGRSTSCSSAFRVSVAPRCLLHEVDQMHGVVVHFPVSLSSWSWSRPAHRPSRIAGVARSASSKVEVAAHALGVDLQAAQHEARLGQRARRQHEGLRHDDPLHMSQTSLASKSVTIASRPRAACWRTTLPQAMISSREIGLSFCGMVLLPPRPLTKGSNCEAERTNLERPKCVGARDMGSYEAHHWDMEPQPWEIEFVRERCDARTRKGPPCGAPAMPNGRCRMHGGLSTGACLAWRGGGSARPAGHRRDHPTARRRN